MAITNMNVPESSNSSHNPNIYVFDSNDKNLPGYKYIIRLTDSNNDPISEFKYVNKRPLDGYGKIDVSYLVSSLLRHSIDFSTDNYWSPAFKLRYKVNVRSQYYFDGWNFEDTYFYSGNNIVLVSSDVHQYQIGDVIKIELDNPSLMPNIHNAFFEVIDLPGYSATTEYPSGLNPNQTILIDASFIATAPNSGRVYSKTSRLIVEDNYYSAGIKEVFKSAVPYLKWDKSYFKNTYTTVGPNFKFLTNIPRSIEVVQGEKFYIPIPLGTTSNGLYQLVYTDGTTYIDYPLVFNNTTVEFINVTADTITSQLDDYEVYIASINDNTTAIGEKIRVRVINECPVEEPYEIVFVDRLGAWSTFRFYKRFDTTLNVNKDIYNKPTNFDDDYSGYDTGLEISRLNIEEDLLLRSGYLKKNQLDYFNELISSPITYIKIDGEYWKCDILTTNNTVRDKVKLKQQEIRVRLSNKNNINY